MKRALIVGLNSYSDGRNKLRGCVSDAASFNNILLSRYNFRETNVLLNSAATKFKIIQQLEDLIKTSQPGDTAVFYFSGHGCQVPSVTESDCFDECLVTYDHKWNSPLRDDDIRDCLKNHKSDVNVSLIIDSCHSGGVVDGGDFKVPWHPPEISEALSAKTPQSKTRIFGRRDVDPWKQRHILYASCRSNEVSVERRFGKRGAYKGVFTAALIKSMSTPVSRRKNWYQLARHVNRRVHLMTQYKQNPVLICDNQNQFDKAFK